MNGLYFKPFRCWFLDRVAITHIHVFERRDQAFSDDRVLQENVILRAVVGGRQRAVTITAARDASFAGLQRCVRPFAQVVIPGEPERFLHIPTPGAAEPRNLPGHPLRELGLEVSTGPVVDFRLREQLRMQPEPGAVPLLYAAHFQTGVLQWPGTGRKPSAIVRNAATERWLWPRGSYVVLRRLSSKEEKRRIVACLVDEAALPEAKVGFENHLNVFHQGRKGLPRELARLVDLAHAALAEQAHDLIGADPLSEHRRPGLPLASRATGGGSRAQCRPGAPVAVENGSSLRTLYRPFAPLRRRRTAL